MKKTSVILISALCITVFLSLASGCNGQKKEKFVESLDTSVAQYDLPVYNSIEEMIEKADAIVLASYSESPTEKEYKQGSHTISNTIYKLKINKIFKGNDLGDTITFSQVGTPNNDEYETKIKPKATYLLFLSKKDNSASIYDAMGLEQGIIEIKGNGTLSPLSKIGVTSEYDGKKWDELQSKLLPND